MLVVGHGEPPGESGLMVAGDVPDGEVIAGVLDGEIVDGVPDGGVVDGTVPVVPVPGPGVPADPGRIVEVEGGVTLWSTNFESRV